MTHHTTVVKVLSLCAVIVILAGCSAGPAASTATAGPTIDLQPTIDQIGTQAAQTIVAGLTQNAPTATPTVQTSTPLPTATLAPTKTPLPPTKMPTATYIPWTSTPIYSPTPLGYACSITSSSPAPTITYTPGSDFDGNWVVKNTGTQTWQQHAVDIKYISGTKFQAKGDLFDLQSDVVSGASYTVIIDMFAPMDPGSYQATWAIIQNSLTICTLNVNITVVK